MKFRISMVRASMTDLISVTKLYDQNKDVAA